MTERLSNFSEEEKLEFVEKLDLWIASTEHWSGNFSKHPASAAVYAYGRDAVPFLVEYLRESNGINLENYNPWPVVEAICRILPPEELPKFPQESRGKLEDLLDIFEVWGVEKGYLSPKH